MFPEEFDLGNAIPIMKSDCYALGMVIYEVLSGQIPFAPHREFVVVMKVLEGKHPESPQGEPFTDELWDVLRHCWEQNPGNQPSSEEVLAYLEGGPPPRLPPSRRSGGMETNTYVELDASTNGIICSFHPRMIVTYLQNIVDVFGPARADQLDASTSGMIFLLHPRMIVTHLQKYSERSRYHAR